MEKAVQAAVQCYQQGGTIFTCGNGGSAADSEHIVGELLKGFLKKRPLSPDVAQRINEQAGADIACRLQQGLGAVSLVSFSAAQTAVINDLGADLMYACLLYTSKAAITLLPRILLRLKISQPWP